MRFCRGRKFDLTRLLRKSPSPCEGEGKISEFSSLVVREGWVSYDIEMKKRNLVLANWKLNPESLEKARAIFNGIRSVAKGA